MWKLILLAACACGTEQPHASTLADVQVIRDTPACAYDELGEVVSSSRAALRAPAVAAGGDGVYNVRCNIYEDLTNVTTRTCIGRVYACKPAEVSIK